MTVAGQVAPSTFDPCLRGKSMKMLIIYSILSLMFILVQIAHAQSGRIADVANKGIPSVVISHTVGIEKTAELIFVSPTQITNVSPPGLPPGRAFVKVREGDRLVRAGVIEITRTAPGLFTLTSDGAGLPAAFVLRVKSDRTQSYELIASFDPDQGKFVPIPIDLDSETDMVFLGLLGTGFRNRSSLDVVTAKIGGMTVEALYAGMPGFPGVYQVNLRIPRDMMRRGEVDVEVAVEGRAVNVVKVVIK